MNLKKNLLHEFLKPFSTKCSSQNKIEKTLEKSAKSTPTQKKKYTYIYNYLLQKLWHYSPLKPQFLQQKQFLHNMK